MVRGVKICALADESCDQEAVFTLWSLIHALSGFALAFACYLLHEYRGTSYRTSMLISVVGLVAWEPFEYEVWVKEHVLNALADIWIGVGTLLIGLVLVEAR